MGIQGRNAGNPDVGGSNGNISESSINTMHSNSSEMAFAVRDYPVAAQKDRKNLEKKLSNAPSRFIRTASRVMQISEVRKTFTRFTSKSRTMSTRPFDRANSVVISTLTELKFVAKKQDGTALEWKDVEQKFRILSSDGYLPSSTFAECLGMGKDKKFAETLFNSLARRHNIIGDSVTLEELKLFWNQIKNESVQTLFEMIDKNADGEISKEEVADIIKLSASTNRLRNIEAQAEEYAEMIMKVLDPKKAGYIKIANLEKLLVEAPKRHAKEGDKSHLDRYLTKNLKTSEDPGCFMKILDHLIDRKWYLKPIYFILDNWQRVWVILLWLGIVVGLFVYKFLQYRNKAVFGVMGYCVCVAKGGAETLKFNMALILLPVCRNLITFLRSKTGLGVAVPFNDNINFHKVIAGGITVGVFLHVVTHLTCDFPRLLYATEEEYEPMKPFFGATKPPHYWWFLKGIEGITGILMVVLMGIAFTLAQPLFRRNVIKEKYKTYKQNQENKNDPKEATKKSEHKLPKPVDKIIGFNAFWYSHHLFVIVYALLIVHGYFLYITKKWYQKTTWMYLAVPMVCYACERLTRALRSSIKRVRILECKFYPEDVLGLKMKKPRGFKYRSGQYMFVKCNKISHLEWHPFSISSAPEDDYLSVHIRNAGDWTRQLKDLFSKDGQGLLAHNSEGRNIPRFPKISIDGPYGAPAQDYGNYDVVMLIGLGIGVTPMISIVRDIMHNTKTTLDDHGSRDVYLENGIAFPSTNVEKKRNKMFKTKKAYFYWVARQDSFKWFQGMEDEVKRMDDKGLIDMHYYCSNVYEEGDARSALIVLIQALNHATKGVDVVTNTHLKSHFGKPTWRKMYEEIATKHPNSRVGVFYCGLPHPVKELRQLALSFSHKESTKFDFHKENF